MLNTLRFLLTIVSFFITSQFVILEAVNEESPAIRHAEKRLESLNYEARYYVHSNQEILNLLSNYQDTLLAFLHESKDEQEFLQGMREIYNGSECVRHCSFYGLKEINFYDFTSPEMKPHLTTVNYDGKEVEAFYNTFKINEPLSSEEREHYYSFEEKNYQRDAIIKPFSLDHQSLKDLQPDTIYNFVLLLDDTVRIALERSGQKEYYVGTDNEVTEKFTHPNHSILAGSANEVVLTAGSFMFFQDGPKRLFFISNKSGHYRPLILSLDRFRRWLNLQGLEESTIIPLPDLNIGQFLSDNFENIEMTISVNKEDSKRLFEIAKTKWINILNQIDISLLRSLASGDNSVLTPNKINDITAIREELTYMRSAYHLFSQVHQSPKLFHTFVKHFGKLKDAIKHNMPGSIKFEAENLLSLLEKHENRIQAKTISYSNESSFYDFLNKKIVLTNRLLAQEDLDIHEYHEIKKTARELGTLLLLLSQDESKLKNGNNFIYKATAAAFFKINLEMTKTHDEFIKKSLQGKVEEDDLIVTIPVNLKSKLKKYISHFTLEPVKIDLAIDVETTQSLLREACFAWYITHYNIASDPKMHLQLEQLIHEEPLESPLLLEQNMKVLKKSAQVLLSISNFFNKPQDTSEQLNWYIDQIDLIINAISQNKTKSGKVNIESMHPFLNTTWPGKICDSLALSSEEDITKALHQIFEELNFLSYSKYLHNSKFAQIKERSEQLSEIFELYKRCKSIKKPYPHSIYDSISKKIDVFLVEMDLDRLNSENNTIPISRKTRRLAKLLFEKLQIK